MQLSALNNESTLENAEAAIRVANDIRKEHGDMGARLSHDILTRYWEYIVVPNEHKAAFLSAVPPLDHLDTFDWLLQRAGPNDSNSNTHAYIRSVLLEAAGRHEEALAGYRNLQSRFGSASGGTLVDATRKAIARLTATK